jgi:hypothetical protein
MKRPHLSTLLPVLLLIAACGRQSEPEQTVSQEPWNGEDWRMEIQLPDIALPVGLHISRDGSEAWFSNGTIPLNYSGMATGWAER